MYRLVSAVYKAHQQKPLDKSPEAVRLLEKSNLDYERNGLGLAPAERKRFKEIKKELSLLSIDFSKRLNEENGGIWFTPDELRGVPADVVSGLKKGEAENEGKVFLTFKYPGFSAPPDPPFLARTNRVSRPVPHPEVRRQSRDPKDGVSGERKQV